LPIESAGDVEDCRSDRRLYL